MGWDAISPSLAALLALIAGRAPHAVRPRVAIGPGVMYAGAMGWMHFSGGRCPSLSASPTSLPTMPSAQLVLRTYGPYVWRHASSSSKSYTSPVACVSSGSYCSLAHISFGNRVGSVADLIDFDCRLQRLLTMWGMEGQVLPAIVQAISQPFVHSWIYISILRPRAHPDQ